MTAQRHILWIAVTAIVMAMIGSLLGLALWQGVEAWIDSQPQPTVYLSDPP